MEKIVGNDYRFKLNENAHNYQEILIDIKNDIDANRKSEESLRKGYWDGYMYIENGIVKVTMAADYSEAEVNLSSNTLKKIKENINTDPVNNYSYIIDNGANQGVIKSCQGLAAKLTEKINDIGMQLYNADGQETFKYYINNISEINQLDKYGEEKRLQRKLVDNSYEIVFNQSFNKKENHFDELWIAYFLVNGTKNLIPAATELGPSRLSLKEALYAEDYGKKKSNLGKEMLQKLSLLGVRFSEDTSDISGNLMVGGKLGDPLRKEDPEVINAWIKKNKRAFNHYPRLSEEALNTLKDEFPSTYMKLRIIMQQELPKKCKHRI